MELDNGYAKCQQILRRLKEAELPEWVQNLADFHNTCRKNGAKRRADSPGGAKTSELAVDFFFCHTKQSRRWSCEDFLRDGLWDYLERQIGFRTFYDRIDLPGGEIEKCTTVAGKSGVLIVVLDDVAPTSWMQRETEKAISCGVPIQTIYCADHFRWEECGNNAWIAKGIAKDLVANAFNLPVLTCIKKAEFIETARKNMVEVLAAVLSGR